MQKHKYKMRYRLFIILLSAVCCLLSPPAHAEDNFNPNYIISDFEILDYNSMSLSEIQVFLQNKNSYLVNYKIKSCTAEDVLNKVECSGKIMSAAEIIYDRATTNKISPKFLLVLLQKEQSLIEEKSPRQSQLDWATGYGCFDGAPCNTYWKGFWKQVNSASLQFIDYMENPRLYTYKAGETYTFTNPYATIKGETTLVTPANQATAGLYNYTPHVYNGNYNFYKIWQRYFTRSYPDGSLLQAEGEAGVWLIEDGMKRPFLTKGALTSRYDEKKIIIVNKSDLDSYLKGAPIKFPQYSLVRSPGGTIFLLVDDKKRGFADSAAFKKIGYNPEEVLSASWEDINAYKDGAPITATSTYPTGALLQDKKTGGVYWVSEGEKQPIWDAIFLKTKYKNKKIIPVSPDELANYKTADPVIFGDGELVKSPVAPAVYLISGGQKRPFMSGKVFEEMGYKWENIVTVSPKVLYLYEEGEAVAEK